MGVGGDLSTTGNLSTTGDLSAAGNLSVTGTSTLGNVGNVYITGGESGQYLQTNGSGNLSWVSLDTDTLANGSSNVSIDSSGGDVTVSVDGEANVAVFSYDGLTVAGSVGATSFSGEASGLGNLTGANVVGDVGGANHANIADVANSVSGSNVSGDVGGADHANIADVANSVAGSNVVGNVAGATMAYGLNAALANVAITGGSNGHVLTTNGSGALSWTNQSVKYNLEIHVDPVTGNDTTGDGSYNRPYATIAKAQSTFASGRTVYLHSGTYSENVTWTQPNCDIVGSSAGGVVLMTGAWTVGCSSPSSVRIKDIAFNGAFTQNGTGRIIFQSSYLRSTFTKTSGEYTQFDDTSAAGTGIIISSAGQVVFNGGQQNAITVSNASAVVSVLNSMSVVTLTATAGTVLLNDSFVYAASNTGNAVTTSAGSAVYLYNSSLVAPNGTVGRMSMGGFWTANDTKYDKANSALTGTNLGTISYFDALNSQGLANVASLQVRGTSTLGPVGNVSISGGTSGQYLQTNGSGALSFSTVSLSNINNGTSNVSVAASGNITIASNGQGNIATFASNGTFATTTINDDVIVTGNLTVQGNTVSVNVAELNVEDPIITEGRAPNNTPLSAADGKDRGLFSYYYDGAEKGAFIGIMTTGAHAGEYVVSTDATVSNNVVTTSSYGNIVVGNVVGNLANGGTSVGIAGADANITMSVGENANVAVVDGLGITVNGKVTVGGTGIGGATLTTTSTDTVALVSIQDAAGLAVEVLIKGADAAGTKFEVATLLLISDGAGTVDYTIFGVTSTSTSTGILSATKNGAVVELNVTPSSSNSTVWTAQYRTI
jgi:hypothetical protein